MTAPRAELIRWRATGAYLATSTSKAGIFDETRLFLREYARTGDVTATFDALVNGGLPQRSRSTRKAIVSTIRARLTRWNPPDWVLEDLARFAVDEDLTALTAALLLHTVRQEGVLYDLVQNVVVERWFQFEREIKRSDVQRYFDAAEPTHPEIGRWNFETREKLAGNLLTVLRDYGLLQGAWKTTHREIVEPIVPLCVIKHLVRLLEAENIGSAEIADHSDWLIWLLRPPRVRALLASASAN